MLAQKSPRFHQIASPMLCTPHEYVLTPPIIHTISFCPPLGKKLKETLVSHGINYLMVLRLVSRLFTGLGTRLDSLQTVAAKKVIMESQCSAFFLQ